MPRCMRSFARTFEIFKLSARARAVFSSENSLIFQRLFSMIDFKELLIIQIYKPNSVTPNIRGGNYLSCSDIAIGIERSTRRGLEANNFVRGYRVPFCSTLLQ